jgi:O-acetyl-ADP-ribose deacetylase (regulator of RNase III)
VKFGATTFSLAQGSITEVRADAIVNAANSKLAGGGGVDGAIHRAGGPAILAECQEIIIRRGPLEPGEAVITGGGSLPAIFVFHTVGPFWNGGAKGEDASLKKCYESSLALAAENKVSTIAFPSISTGAYRFPIERASEIAINSCAAWCREHDSLREIIFVLFSPEDYGLYEGRLGR